MAIVRMGLCAVCSTCRAKLEPLRFTLTLHRVGVLTPCAHLGCCGLRSWPCFSLLPDTAVSRNPLSPRTPPSVVADILLSVQPLASGVVTCEDVVINPVNVGPSQR